MSNIKTMIVVRPIESDTDMKLRTLISGEHPIAFKSVTNVKELISLVADSRYVCDYIAIDLQTLRTHNIDAFDMLNALSTMLSCSPVKNTAGELVPRSVVVGILVGTKDPLESIKELIGFPLVQYIGLRGGDGFTEEEVSQSLVSIIGDDYTLPRQVEAMLVKQRKANKSQNDITLTPRQRQILNLIANRGLSNKMIAKMLNISESTVKLHAGALLRKFRVRNRTQLALFAKDSVNITQ